MSRTAHRVRGYTLVEAMIALTLGIIVVAGIITVFMSMRQVYSTALSQASVQNADNAISAILSPAIRGAGFAGCGTLTKGAVPIISNPGNVVNNYTFAVQGFDATGTPGTVSGKGANAYVIAVDNDIDDDNLNDWTHALDASFATAHIAPEKGGDVLVLSGAMPGVAPAGVNTINQGAADFTVTDNPLSNVVATLTNAGLPAPAALSDCGKSVIFMVTAVSGSGNAVTVTHAAATPGNTTAAFQPAFPPGVQFMPLAQEAFYVAQGAGGQSALYEATVVGGGWVTKPIIPGVENMQVLYGVSSGGTYKWVPAGAVGDWSTVSAVRIGFLIEGGLGSSPKGAAQTFNVLGTTVTAPSDTRLRHTYTLTAYLRNVSL